MHAVLPCCLATLPVDLISVFFLEIVCIVLQISVKSVLLSGNLTFSLETIHGLEYIIWTIAISYISRTPFKLQDKRPTCVGDVFIYIYSNSHFYGISRFYIHN